MSAWVHTDQYKNKHVYRQSQVRKPTGIEVKLVWMLADHRDGLSSSIISSLILESLVGLSVSTQSAVDLVSETLCSNPALSRGRQRVSFRFEYHLPVPDHQNNKHICIYIHMHICIYVYVLYQENFINMVHQSNPSKDYSLIYTPHWLLCQVWSIKTQRKEGEISFDTPSGQI